MERGPKQGISTHRHKVWTQQAHCVGGNIWVDKVSSPGKYVARHDRVGRNKPVKTGGDEDKGRAEALVDGAFVMELPAP